ncbi:DUF7848 domain-containing protein, partial [Streptomyces phaeochromogenes]
MAGTRGRVGHAHSRVGNPRKNRTATRRASTCPQAAQDMAQDWCLRHAGRTGHDLFRRLATDHARVTRNEQPRLGSEGRTSHPQAPTQPGRGRAGVSTFATYGSRWKRSPLKLRAVCPAVANVTHRHGP